MPKTAREIDAMWGFEYLRYLNDHFEHRNWVPVLLRDLTYPANFRVWQEEAAKRARIFRANIMKFQEESEMGRPEHVKCSNCCYFKPLKETKKRGWCMTEGRRYDRKLYAHDDFCPQWCENWPEPNQGSRARA